MAVKVSVELKKFYAEKTFDLTNIGAGALLFGQFLSEKGLSWIAIGAGLMLVMVGYIASYLLYQEGGKK